MLERAAIAAPAWRQRLSAWSAEMSQKVERSWPSVVLLIAERKTEPARMPAGSITLDGLRTTPALVRTLYDRVASHRFVQQPQATIARWNGMIETQLAGTRALETWRSMGKSFQGPKQVAVQSHSSLRRSSLIWLADTLDRTADRMKQAAVSLEALACEAPDLQLHCESEEGEFEAEGLASP